MTFGSGLGFSINFTFVAYKQVLKGHSGTD